MTPRTRTARGEPADTPEDEGHGARPLVRGAVLLLLIVAAAALLRWGPPRLPIDLETLRGALAPLRESPAAPAVVVGTFVAGGVVLVPITLLTVATTLAFGPVLGFVYAILGCFSSASLGYGAGHVLGHDFVRRIAGPRLERMTRRLARHGLAAVVTVRVVPVAPFTVVNLMIGASGIRYRDFALGSLGVMTPGVLALNVFEYGLERSIHAPDAGSLLVIGGAIVVLLVLSLWIHRRAAAGRSGMLQQSGEEHPTTSELPVLRDRRCLCVPDLREGKGELRLFTEGDDLFDEMIATIGRARRAVRLESFIFQADEVGRAFVRALAARARAGADVRVYLDFQGAGFAAFHPLEREFEEAGVRFRWFHPWSWRRPTQYRRRNHRKLLVVDEDVAFIGGFNIRRENSRRLFGEGRQRDSHVEVRGELARLAALEFDRLWDDGRPLHPEAVPEEVEGLDALLVRSSSRRCQQRLACLHAGLIDRARRHVYLTTPYFCPATDVERALRDAARRGVDARLLIPRSGDPPIVGWATRSAYAALLEAGVRIFEYQPRKLHAKTSVIDGEWATVGSANLDYLSLFVNHELVLIARDRDLARALAEQYERDLSESVEVEAGAWRRRGLGERSLERIGHALRRLF